MWIFLSIISFIIILITIILLLPFSFILKTDENGDFVLLYKFLFKTFGENPNPNQPIVKALKEVSGVTRLDTQKLKESSKKGELLSTLRENLSLILKLLKELLKVLKNCTVKVLKIDIVCAEDNAADTAMSYGLCYAVISPFLNIVHNTMKVRKKGEKININADFEGKNESFKFEAVLVTQVYKLLIALFKLAQDEAKRISAEEAKKTNPKSRN